MKYPIGIQSFDQIISEGYIAKTRVRLSIGMSPAFQWNVTGFSMESHRLFNGKPKRL